VLLRGCASWLGLSYFGRKKREGFPSLFSLGFLQHREVTVPIDTLFLGAFQPVDALAVEDADGKGLILEQLIPLEVAGALNQLLHEGILVYPL